MPSPCSASSHAISVNLGQGISSVAYLRKKKLARTTWLETHQPQGIRRPMDKATADSRSVQSFATRHENFVIGRFQTRARNGLSIWDWPVYSRPLPYSHRHPFSDFFWGGGERAAVHRLSETDNSSSNCPSKLTDKVRRMIHSKLKPFHFQIKTYYLSDANYETDNPSLMNNPSLVWKRQFLL